MNNKEFEKYIKSKIKIVKKQIDNHLEINGEDYNWRKGYEYALKEILKKLKKEKLNKKVSGDPYGMFRSWDEIDG